jgi:hypothetical protein
MRPTRPTRTNGPPRRPGCRPRPCWHHGRDHPDGLLRQRRDDARLLRCAGRGDRHGAVSSPHPAWRVAQRRRHHEGHVSTCWEVASLSRTELGQHAGDHQASLAVTQGAVPCRDAHTTEPLSACQFSVPVGGGCRPTR